MVSLVVIFFSINEAISCLHCKLQSLLTTLPDQRSFSESKTNKRLACSRLRDGGGKSFSNKKCEKRAGAGERRGGGACTHFFNGLFRYISS